MGKTNISVLMPVYNGAKYLEISIESILKQSIRDFEFIIVDDGSTDSSFKIIDRYIKKDKRIILLKNKTHLGTTKSLNKGLSVAKGKYIVRMDADDWSSPDRLKIQCDFMEKNLDIGVSGGSVDICDKNLKHIYTRKYLLTDKSIRKKMFLYSPFAHPATIWRGSLIKQLGGYNENMPLSQDAELYFRVGSVAKFANLKDVLIKLRMHENSSSVSKNRAQEKYAIYARIKGVMEYGYSARVVDWVYIIFRLFSMFLIPTKIKFWMFNQLRRSQ